MNDFFNPFKKLLICHKLKVKPPTPSIRLPGPSARVSTAGSDVPSRGSISAAGNRRSQGFNDKTKTSSHSSRGRPLMSETHTFGLEHVVTTYSCC